MIYNSYGDVTTDSFLGNGNAEVKLDLATLSQEVSPGKKYNLTEELGGDFSYLADIENNLCIDVFSHTCSPVGCIEDIAYSVLYGREPEVALRTFSALFMVLCIDFEEIFDRYVNKNVLNLFRRKNGYKEGTYNRTWNGKDDNDVLVEVAATMDRDSENYFDELYAKLEEIYNKS